LLIGLLRTKIQAQHVYIVAILPINIVHWWTNE